MTLRSFDEHHTSNSTKSELLKHNHANTKLYTGRIKIFLSVFYSSDKKFAKSILQEFLGELFLFFTGSLLKRNLFFFLWVMPHATTTEDQLWWKAVPCIPEIPNLEKECFFRVEALTNSVF